MEIDKHTLSRPVIAEKSKGLGGNPAAAPPSPGDWEGALLCSPEVEEVSDDLDEESLLLFSAPEAEPVFSSNNKAICDSSERLSRGYLASTITTAATDPSRKLKGR